MGCVGLVMLLVLVVVRAVLGGTHMLWFSCVAMVSVLVVGLASLRPLLCFNWALFASVLVLAWLRCPTIVVFTGPCLLLLVMVLVLVVVCEVCCGTTIVLVSVLCHCLYALGVMVTSGL